MDRALAMLLAGILLSGCSTVGPAPSPSSPGAPTAVAVGPTASVAAASPRVAASAAPSPSADPAHLEASADGLDLRVAIEPTTAAAGRPIRFSVTIRNDRAAPLWYSPDNLCAPVEVLPAVPLDPVGKAWTGHLGAFKVYALGHANQAPNPVSGVLDVGVPGASCPYDGVDVDLAPGASASSTLEWHTDYVPGIPVTPGFAEVRVTILYDAHLVTRPGCLGGVVCSSREASSLHVTGEVRVTPGSRRVLTPGQAIDAALSNRAIRAFVASMPIGGRCGINLWLENNAERYLPGGPAWDFEEFCEHPRRFIRVALDPWTGTVNGIDECTVSCWR